MNSTKTPFPSQSPFTEEQNAWLSKLIPSLSRDQMLWLSGWLSATTLAGPAQAQTPLTTTAGAPAPSGQAQPATKTLSILYATESGNAEGLADEAKKQASRKGFTVKVKDIGDEDPGALAREEQVLIIASTWGEGDPPERAIEYTQKLFSDSMPRLEGLRYSVLSLGDTSYEHFCQYGKDLDQRLEALGAKRVHPRVDCDLDFEEPFKKWFGGAIGALEKELSTAPAPASAAPVPVTSPVVEVLDRGAADTGPAVEYSRSNPFPAEVIEKINLNGTGSEKETLHLELSLAGSGLTYEPGDAMGVVPRNCPLEVNELIETLGVDGGQKISPDGREKMSFREALLRHFDATNLSRQFVEKYAGIAQSSKLDKLIKDRDALKNYLSGRHLIDLFNDYPARGVDPADLAPLFRKLPPRIYSISSSLKAHPDEVHLTVAAVRYHIWGRNRKGVCSTFFADRVQGGQTVPIYLQGNKNFRLPDDPDLPIIMVGPGTGIAPFRAFVEERAETGARGKNWLFFGDQHFTTDFLYQTEWQGFLKDGVLTRMDVAFSRDTPEKVYVQDRLLERSREIYAWLQEGAHFYVCGDASRMAKDVHRALESIVAKEADCSETEAAAYVRQLKKEKRYQRDVY